MLNLLPKKEANIHLSSPFPMRKELKYPATPASSLPCLWNALHAVHISLATPDSKVLNAKVFS